MTLEDAIRVVLEQGIYGANTIFPRTQRDDNLSLEQMRLIEAIGVLKEHVNNENDDRRDDDVRGGAYRGTVVLGAERHPQ